jgi:hypothetical protein
MTNWLPISVDTPRDEMIILWRRGSPPFTDRLDSRSMQALGATHWQPMPEPPGIVEGDV